MIWSLDDDAFPFLHDFGRSYGVPVQGQTKKPNVVVIVLDQLQADQLHCYGNPRLTSPNIDKLAARGVLLSHYFSVAPWTSPSFASLHTSLYPSKHGVTMFWSGGLPTLNKDVPTLAENLHRAGYYTIGYSNNQLGGKNLIGSGFDRFTEGGAEATNITQRVRPDTLAPVTIPDAINWLKENASASSPFFLYVHLMEPHSPYDPPPSDDLFKTDAYPYLHYTGEFNAASYSLAHGGLLWLADTGNQKAVERLIQLYDGKIHFVDRYVGELLDQLHVQGLDNKTYVILTSDHGELLYSHPDDWLTNDHRSLYDPVLHIPFIIAGPKIPKGEVVSGLSSNVDAAPTILALAGAPALNDAEGHILVPMLTGGAPTEDKYVFAEEDVEVPLRAVRNSDYKLIRNLWDGSEQLFDLKKDVKELHDVSKEQPSVAKDLSQQLDSWMRLNQPSRDVQLRRWRIYAKSRSLDISTNNALGGHFLIRPRQSWHLDVSPKSGNYDATSFWAEPGNGTRLALWRGETPWLGTYRISVFVGKPGDAALATNAPFTVVTAVGRTTVRLNLQLRPGDWQEIGVFTDPRYVELSNDADGAVVADTIRLERIEGP